MPSSWTNGGKKGKDLRGKKKGKEVAHCSRSLLTNFSATGRLLEQEGRHKEKQYTCLYQHGDAELMWSLQKWHRTNGDQENSKWVESPESRVIASEISGPWVFVPYFTLHLIVPSLGIIELHLCLEKAYWGTLWEEEKMTGWKPRQ